MPIFRTYKNFKQRSTCNLIVDNYTIGAASILKNVRLGLWLYIKGRPIDM